MRPVNLIPSDQRRGARKPMRGGPLAYVVVGALVAALLGIATLVITSNQISDRKAEIVRLEAEQSAVEGQAAALAAYTKFHGISEQRDATLTSLANSRFDWERVMRELALVLPSDVWLTNLGASATSQTSAGSSSSSGGALRASVAGPALTLGGCARGQEGVAGFVQALKDIDGVTRVGVESSSLNGSEGAGSTSGSAPTEASSGCEAASMAQFQMVVAFDAAPVSNESAAAPATPAPESSSTTTTAAPSEE